MYLDKIIGRLEASCIRYENTKEGISGILTFTRIKFRLRGIGYEIIIKEDEIISNINTGHALTKMSLEELIRFLDKIRPLINIPPEYWSIRQQVFITQVFEELKKVEPGCYTIMPCMERDGTSSLFLWFTYILDGKDMEISVEVPLERTWVNENVVERTLNNILKKYRDNKEKTEAESETYYIERKLS